MNRLEAHGLTVQLPRGFEGRIYLRDAPAAEQALAINNPQTSSLSPRQLVHPARSGWAPELPHPVIHLANFALPRGRGDFGSGAVEGMTSANVFIAVLEYGSAEVGTALFSHRGVPLPEPGEVSPAALQRRLPGQAGWQRFFSVGDRPFCAYVVVGSARNATSLTAQARAALTGVRVGSR